MVQEIIYTVSNLFGWGKNSESVLLKYLTWSNDGHLVALLITRIECLLGIYITVEVSTVNSILKCLYLNYLYSLLTISVLS